MFPSTVEIPHVLTVTRVCYNIQLLWYVAVLKELRHNEQIIITLGLRRKRGQE